jgi:hypothetical protein
MEINTTEELIEFLRRENASLRTYSNDASIEIIINDGYIGASAIKTAIDFIERHSPDDFDVGLSIGYENRSIVIHSSEPEE